MTKRALLALLALATLPACDTVVDPSADRASGPQNAARSANPDVRVEGDRLVFTDKEAFERFVKEAKAKEQPVLSLLNWGDAVGFTSYVHAEALAAQAEEKHAKSRAAASAERPATVGGHDRFFKSLLNTAGELQVGDQLLRVDATHATLHAADGSVLRQTPIEAEPSEAESERVYPQQSVVTFGPIDESDRQLRRYRMTATIDTDEYLLYWTVQGITEHAKLKRNWYRGWYYGSENASLVRVTCTTTFYDPFLGRPTVSNVVTESDQATNNDYVDVQLDWTLNTTYRPQFDATCTHYARATDGYSATTYTSLSR